MSEHPAMIAWRRAPGEAFIDKRYSRAHRWRFDGGVEVFASSSPDAVPLPFSRADHVDPEEAFVAAIASCHMLTFLWAAAKAGHVVDAYDDHAVGVMARNARDRLAVTRVTLAPAIRFSGAKQPSDAIVAALHEEAHDECYIANSVACAIDVAGSWSWNPPLP